MERQSEEKRQSSPNTLSPWKRRALGISLATTAVISGGPLAMSATEHVNNIPAAEMQRLESDTVPYTVENGGYMWTVAEELGQPDANFAVEILQDLNPEYAHGEMIPDGETITVPSEYVSNDKKMSIDLDANTATIVRD